jgi:hypothetical protein
MENLASDTKDKDAYDSSKASRFQFKSNKRSKRHRSKDGDEDRSRKRSSRGHHTYEDGETRRRHRDPERKHKHRSSHRDRTFTRNGEYQNPDYRHRETLYDGLNEACRASPSIHPDVAFRESLFDAMADDEGAEYWEGVYGQPVHIYDNTKPGPDGKLERMNDEEYADYVRSKMWEKSHQHILEERAAREEARKKLKEDQRGQEKETNREAAEREKIMRQMEESLKRGEERRRVKAAEAAWVRYLSRWDHLKNNSVRPDPGQDIRQIIPWPVASGKAQHVEPNEIDRFLRVSSAWNDDAAAFLKVERVRWHPDKMQQRFGQHVDTDTMKLVTAVFQVVDRLWTERIAR